MKSIALISSTLPPAYNGLGDYTACLAAELSSRGSLRVRVLTASEPTPNPINNVSVEPCMDLSSRRGVLGLIAALEREPVDVVILQFEQFAWGRWGLNPWLPNALKTIKRRGLCKKMAVMFHECIVPALGFKRRVMRVWQKRQLEALNRMADARFFSVARWAQEAAARYPASPSVHLPVGSNLPWCPPGRGVERDELGIPATALVCGLFGSAHGSRRFDWIAEAVRSLTVSGKSIVVLYIGPEQDVVRRWLGNTDLICTGALPSEQVSAHLRLMDLFLSPYDDGLTTRRGSAMAALQHGLPVVSTSGGIGDRFVDEQGDPVFASSSIEEGAEAFAAVVLRFANDPEGRRLLGDRGAVWYRRHASWERVADTLIGQFF